MNSVAAKLFNSITSKPLVWALAVAVLARFIPIATHIVLVGGQIPYNFGGLFARFASEIHSHGYALPGSIPFYTPGGIPFAYPPASFYLLALFNDVLPISEITAINILPTLIAVASIYAFYLLVRQLPLKQSERVAAVLVWAILPNAYREQAEAAGIAESLGTLALILLMTSLLYYLDKRTPLSIAAIAAAWALAFLASPGSALASFAIVGIVWLGAAISSADIKEFRSHLISIGIAFAATAVATSFYWLSVISNHGIDVFTSPLINETGVGSILFIVQDTARELLSARLIQTGGVVVPVMALLGTVVLLKRNHWLIPVWYLSLVIIPRESFWLIAAPTAVMVGIGVINYLLPLIHDLWTTKRNSKRTFFFSRLVVIVLLISFTFAPVKITSLQLLDVRKDFFLTEQHLQTMDWVNNNVGQGSKFIVVANKNVLEWFPHVSEREVLNMPFGSEWEPDENLSMTTLRDGASFCENLRCLRDSTINTIDDLSIFIFVDRKSSIFSEAQNSEYVYILRSADDGLIGLMTLSP